MALGIERDHAPGAKLCREGCDANRTKVERRVLPRGVFVRTASMRTRLTATAVNTCCKCTLGKPSKRAFNASAVSIPLPKLGCLLLVSSRVQRLVSLLWT